MDHILARPFASLLSFNLPNGRLRSPPVNRLNGLTLFPSKDFRLRKNGFLQLHRVHVLSRHPRVVFLVGLARLPRTGFLLVSPNHPLAPWLSQEL